MIRPVSILLLLLFALPVSAQAERPAAPQAQAVSPASDGWDVRSIGRGALIGAGCGALIGLFAWFKRRGSK